MHWSETHTERQHITKQACFAGRKGEGPWRLSQIKVIFMIMVRGRSVCRKGRNSTKAMSLCFSYFQCWCGCGQSNMSCYLFWSVLRRCVFSFPFLHFLLLFPLFFLLLSFFCCSTSSILSSPVDMSMFRSDSSVEVRGWGGGVQWVGLPPYLRRFSSQFLHFVLDIQIACGLHVHN